MSGLTTSVLIASCRPLAVTRCLESLAVQTTPPNEVIVAWQGDDTATRDAANAAAADRGLAVRVVHSSEVGVVPAENAALSRASGAIILLIDDDAVAPSDWVARHLSYYRNPRVGAVGGPFDNYHPDGTPFPKRSAEPVGKITWYGKSIGNIHDHDLGWRSRGPTEVHHLAGGNMSLRREAFARFESRLRRYWQLFEMEVCLQVRRRGYRVLFDFANVIEHHPTSQTFVAGREGDLTVKIFNSAYNHAFVMSKHLSGWRRAACLAYMLGVGSVNTPGLAGFFAGVLRHGNPGRELTILRRTLQSRFAGWQAGTREKPADQPPA
jgi:GT2 family glycosyltransferase